MLDRSNICARFPLPAQTQARLRALVDKHNLADAPGGFSEFRFEAPLNSNGSAIDFNAGRQAVIGNVRPGIALRVINRLDPRFVFARSHSNRHVGA